jgi:hypothetical protein
MVFGRRIDSADALNTIPGMRYATRCDEGTEALGG